MGSRASSSAPRYATVGVAKDYRLVFEREWRIPQDTDSQRLPGDVLVFPARRAHHRPQRGHATGRRELVYTTHEVIRKLAAA